MYWTSSTHEAPEPIRLRINQSIPSLSRRGAEKAIKVGRITVNGKCPSLGLQVAPTDIVLLDGVPQSPKFNRSSLIESTHDVNDKSIANSGGCKSDVCYANENRIATQTYIKMWKVEGIICTTDMSVKENIISFGNFKMHGVDNRLFPVGRLDENTSGLILITSDGNFMHSLLGVKSHVTKVYEVTTKYDLTDDDIKMLTNGITIITTTTSRKVVTAPTLPCKISRNPHLHNRYLFIIITMIPSIQFTSRIFHLFCLPCLILFFHKLPFTIIFLFLIFLISYVIYPIIYLCICVVLLLK
jgi:pseudouridine synthase